MAEQSDQPKNLPSEKEQPEVFAVSQDQDGSFHFSRRSFIALSAAIGGTLLLRGACPRFGTKPAPNQPIQAGIGSLSRVYIHTEPSIASNIADTLQQNEYVRLVTDHPDLGWVEVITENGQHGWIKRDFVDFSRAIKSTSPNFDLQNKLTPPPEQVYSSRNFSVQLRSGKQNSSTTLAAGRSPTCGEAIQNGNFESGSVAWTEVSTGTIIRNDWPDPYQGSWVAWFGGPDADEKLTQLFHVSADVEDAQTLNFYLKVTTQETGSQVYDIFRLRFMDAVGNTLTTVMVADNTSPTNWAHFWVDLVGMSGFADQDMQIQFECVTNSSNDTYFVLDSVSLDLACVAASPTPTQTPTQTQTPTPTEIVYYVYLPVVIRDPTPTPSSTPSPSKTPCQSHCSSDCSYDCSSDCPTDYCSSDCTLDCIYDCPFDCIYDCGYDYCSYDCSYDWYP